MRLYTKEELIAAIRKVVDHGWHRSIKRTVDTRNDGAVGNTLEKLLDIKENNLPIPNMREWELKGQRAHTSSLVTLKHIEPSPRAVEIVPRVLLPQFGWKHRLAGIKYPKSEMSFRSTTSATSYTRRGFRIVVDHVEKKVKLEFVAAKADSSAPDVSAWLELVEKRRGLGPLDPEPYWGFEDLNYAIGEKVKNCFYVVADSRIDGGREFFCYRELHILSGFSFAKFLNCVEQGVILVDFDARTGHNHGTKFRIKQDSWHKLYSSVKRVI
ncbi:MAG: MvaI/BcnI family restriction endonuclease [candidate division WOR-3 bacterium]